MRKSSRTAVTKGGGNIRDSMVGGSVICEGWLGKWYVQQRYSILFDALLQS